MSVMELFFLGTAQVRRDGTAVELQTSTEVALLAYLALTAQPHSHDSLVALLWPCSDAGEGRLLLHRALSSIEAACGADCLLLQAERAGMNPQATVWLDVADFRRLLSEQEGGVSVQALERAVERYRGDLLADFIPPEAPAFVEWLHFERQSVRQAYLDALDDLLALLEGTHTLEQAIFYARRRLAADPFHEPAHTRLIRLYAQSGRPGAARRQYRRCARLLRQRLGREPGPETAALWAQLESGAFRRPLGRPPDVAAQAGEEADILVFLNTDIEDSTRLWDRHRQAMLPVLLRHNSILEELINAHGGRILHLTGDGVMACFEGGTPLACVLALQQRLAQTDWGEVGQLRVRMGLHAVKMADEGHDFFRGSELYFGPALNYSARIASVAWGGQIVVSSQVTAFCPLPPGAAWVDLGRHWLRSVDEPQQLAGLAHPDLPYDSFPPLRSQVRATIWNRLARQTSFVGRRQELAALTAMLVEPQRRLLTLVGLGGIGKTRLALEAADQVASRFAQGVVYVDLAPLSSPDMLVSAIAKALSFPFRGQEEPKEQLLAFLQEQALLLLLDNFEHLIEGAALLSQMLARAPRLTLLVTSRTPLNLVEEWLFPVEGLPHPQGAVNTLADLARLPQPPAAYSAVDLFIQRARQVQPAFALPGQEVEVIRICQLVEGMPLGIELAAVWTRMLPCRQIAAEISRNLDILSTPHQNMADRHRSLRAVFEYSWQLLPASEQQALARLSIFQSGFTLEAAGEIAGATLFTLYSLMNKSLLRRAGPPGQERYTIHELLRQFAAEKLEQCLPDKDEVARRHAAYYARWLLARETILEGGQNEQPVLAEIDVELENVRRAWQWACAHNRVEELGHLVDGLYSYYSMRCLYYEGKAAFEQAAATLSNQLGSRQQTESLVLAKLLVGRGEFAYLMGYLAEARAILHQALPLCQCVEARRESAYCYKLLGMVAYVQGEYEVARPLLQAGAEIAVEAGESHTQGIILMTLGAVELALGHHEAALRCHLGSLSCFEQLHNDFGMANSLRFLGIGAYRRGDYAAAEQYYQQSLQIFRAIGHEVGAALVVENLGLLAQARGDYEEAHALFHDSLELGQKNQAYIVTLRSLRRLGQVMGAWEQPEKAFDYLHEALATAVMAQAVPDALGILVDFASGIAGALPGARALQISAYVATHPAAEAETRQQAESLQQRLLAAGSSPPALPAARQETLESIIALIDRPERDGATLTGGS